MGPRRRDGSGSIIAAYTSHNDAMWNRLVPVLLIGWLGLGMAELSQSSPESHPGRVYHIVFLKRDPERKPISKEQGDQIQAAHTANIHAMAERGVLVAAGPFEDTPPVISGVFFFATSSIAEARRIAAADPNVAEHRNTVQVLAWRGPTGIGDEYKRLHTEKPETPEGMGVHPFIILRRSGKQFDQTVMQMHAAYVASLRSDGKVVANGAVEDDSSAFEILIFSRIADTEAASLAAADPAISNGTLSVEAHRWWCSANVFPG